MTKIHLALPLILHTLALLSSGIDDTHARSCGFTSTSSLIPDADGEYDGA